MDNEEPKTKLSQIDQKLKTFGNYIMARRNQLAAVLPKHLTPERMAKVAISAVSRNEKLIQCTLESLYLAVAQAAQCGLEAGSPLGHAYLVPFWNRTAKPAQMECQLILGYRGLIDMARRSGQIVTIEAHVVREGDEFEYELGLNPVLRHIPDLEAVTLGKLKFVYAVAKLKDGGSQCELMTKAEVNAIRKRSRASDIGPWVSDYDEMARKTVVRRIVKYLPVSVEMAETIREEEEPFEVIDIEALSVTTSPPTDPNEALAEHIEANGKGESAPPAEEEHDWIGLNRRGRGDAPSLKERRELDELLRDAGQSSETVCRARKIDCLADLPREAFDEIVEHAKDAITQTEPTPDDAPGMFEDGSATIP